MKDPTKARKKIRHDDETRSKIQAALIIRRLEMCLNGEIELTAAQVTCGKTLLNKVLPDLQAVTMDGKITLDPVQQLLEMVNGTAKPIPRTD